jgi:hypothetical protein
MRSEKFASGLCNRSSEGSSFVAKEFAFKKCARNRSTVDDNERFIAPGTAVVDGFCHNLFARTRLALDQYCAVKRSDHPNVLQHVAKGLARTNQIIRDHCLILSGITTVVLCDRSIAVLNGCRVKRLLGALHYQWLVENRKWSVADEDQKKS